MSRLVVDICSVVFVDQFSFHVVSRFDRMSRGLIFWNNCHTYTLLHMHTQFIGIHTVRSFLPVVKRNTTQRYSSPHWCTRREIGKSVVGGLETTRRIDSSSTFVSSTTPVPVVET